MINNNFMDDELIFTNISEFLFDPHQPNKDSATLMSTCQRFKELTIKFHPILQIIQRLRDKTPLRIDLLEYQFKKKWQWNRQDVLCLRRAKMEILFQNEFFTEQLFTKEVFGKKIENNQLKKELEESSSKRLKVEEGFITLDNNLYINKTQQVPEENFELLSQLSRVSLVTDSIIEIFIKYCDIKYSSKNFKIRFKSDHEKLIRSFEDRLNPIDVELYFDVFFDSKSPLDKLKIFAYIEDFIDLFYNSEQLTDNMLYFSCKLIPKAIREYKTWLAKELKINPDGLEEYYINLDSKSEISKQFKFAATDCLCEDSFNDTCSGLCNDLYSNISDDFDKSIKFLLSDPLLFASYISKILCDNDGNDIDHCLSTLDDLFDNELFLKQISDSWLNTFETENYFWLSLIEQSVGIKNLTNAIKLKRDNALKLKYNSKDKV